MNITVAYTKRTCKTGRALFDALRRSFPNTKRIRDSNSNCNTNFLLRYGNASNIQGGLEINKREAVNNASNKRKMMEILNTTEGVRISTIDFNSPDNCKDDDGFFYVRRSHGNIEYTNITQPNDLYYTKPIKHNKEYRVHVFNGKVIGIFEKVPNESNTKLYKSFNCKFRRCDPEISTCNKTAQQMAIKAVESLGLVFGGVDVILGQDRKFYISEVNSGAGLNSKMIDKFITELTNYIGEING